jgi:uncharacterized protein (TIGR00106 family)
MAVVQVTVVPLGTGDTSLSPYVRDVLQAAAGKAGVKVSVGPNGTALEGELDVLWPVIRAMHEAPFGAGVKRVMTLVAVDDRRDKRSTLEGKVAAVSGA